MSLPTFRRHHHHPRRVSPGWWPPGRRARSTRDESHAPSRHRVSDWRWLRRLVALAAAVAGGVVVVAPQASAATMVLGLVPTVDDVIKNATTAVTGLLALLATFFLTLAGARYLFASGDPSQVEQAKQALKSAGIGYILAMIAPLITTILVKIVGA